MKRLFWALPILLLGISASAFADSITIGLSPNNGSGDNFGFSLIQPGFVVGFEGGTPYGFFNDPSAGLYFANPAVFRSATVAPEPGTLGLMGTGLISLFVLARKRFWANNQRTRAS